ncbi:MAG TPA: FGGY-family carbohydrate kinase [Bacteroidales bacterium]|nr:FGGY-family carbohydrate kinase [Bacteroidales bacterium]
MSLLGIDIGTTGCKAVAFSLHGIPLAGSYRDYEIVSEKEGHAVLNSYDIWNKVLEIIKDVALQTSEDPVQALSVSSIGEAMVPVTRDRKILGNSILGSDQRGTEFLELLESSYTPEDVYRITGDLPGTFQSMSKLAWIRKYQSVLYQETDYFLSWADLICYILGGKPVSNHSLSGRTLLFDIHNCSWSDELLSLLDLDKFKFATPHPSGCFLGMVRENLAKKLHLGNKVAIVSGGHDQCCAALGSGLRSDSKAAMYGIGTYICIVPVFSKMPDSHTMYRNKLHIEHHVVPGSYISFIYNQSGGALVKWFRNTFSSAGESKSGTGHDSYSTLFSEIPGIPGDIIVLPLFGATGPPDFLNGSRGCLAGLSLSHTRGDILRAILEGISFYVRDCFEKLGNPFFDTHHFVATGGGSVSDSWLQITADILGKPVIRNKVTEASSLGAAIIAGMGSKLFTSFDEAMDSMVHMEVQMIPDKLNKDFYEEKYQRYKRLNELIKINHT